MAEKKTTKKTGAGTKNPKNEKFVVVSEAEFRKQVKKPKK